MGSTLTGQIVAETYDSLLKVTDNNTITGTLKRITDGFGNDTPLLLSSTDVKIDGNLVLTGTTSQYVRGDGTFATMINTSTLVPYTGATSSVNLGEYQLLAGQITFDQTPTIAGGVGILRWNDADGTLDLGLKGGNVTLQIGQEQVVRVVNGTGANLLESQYRAVKVIGAQGQRLQIDLAQANNDLNSATTIGIVTENINNNQEGFICTNGQVREINTTGSLQGETWEDGDVLYLSPTTAGHITNVKPAAPNHLIVIGYVEYAHAIHGKIFVKVDNGYELDELHNVLITTPTNGQVLAYDSATSLWKNSSNGNGTVTSVSGTGTVSGLTLSGTVTSSGSLTLGGTLSLTSANVTDALGYTPVTNARTLTINGTSYDLSADRSWTIASGGITTLNTLTASTQTFAVGTSGSDFNISSSTSTHTFNIPNASATARGLITTGTQTIAGDKTFTGLSTTFQNTINAQFSIDGTGGFRVMASSSNGAINSATYSLLGANTLNYKQYIYASGATLNANYNFATLMLASSTLTEAASGTHAIVSQLAIKPIVLTNGTATTTNAATVYIEGAASGTATITNNYAVWVDSGDVRIDGTLLSTNQFNRQTASYTLVLSDWGKIVEMNVASANNLTVPLNSSVAFPIGTEIQVLQYGAGQTTIVATGGVTLRSKSSQLKIGNQYTGVTLVKVGTDEWYVIGNVSA